MKIPISQLIVSADSSIKDALINLNNSALGICFICDEENILIGTITDGDIRRKLLSGSNLTDVVISAANTNFCFLNYESRSSDILANFKEGVDVIPLLSDSGKLVDYANRQSTHYIPVLSPDLSGKELEYVTKCIETSWISSQGKYVTEFENKFSQLHLNRKSLAVSNGTTALHLILATLPLNPGDEVIIPNITFAACINVVIQAGLTPVLCDVNEKNWCISEDSIHQLITPRTRAIMAVHLYGNVCNLDFLSELCDHYNLYLIEDCAEAIGSRYRGSPVGTFGDAASFSFFGNKTITTGEGGMVLFKDEAFYEKANILRDHGMSKQKRYWQEFAGFNYRMTNMQAAVGVAQLERLDDIVAKKIWILEQYQKLLIDYNFIDLYPDYPNHIIHSNWLYTIVLANNISRDTVLDNLLQRGIECRPVFYPLNSMEPYQKYSNFDYLNSHRVSSQGISLPSSYSLNLAEIKYIVSNLVEICLSNANAL